MAERTVMSPAAGEAATREMPLRGVAGEDGEHAGLSAFFMIGIVINAALILVFAVWAFREWRKGKDGSRGGHG